jgi:hypothetical protein
MFLDLCDTEFIAADGTLHHIDRRKWNVFNVDALYKTVDVPAERSPDWVLTWTSDTGLKSEPISKDANDRWKEIASENH